MVSTKFTCTIPIHIIRNILAGKLTPHRCQLLRYAIILLSTFESVEYKDLTAKMGKVSLNELAHMFRLSVTKTQAIIKELINMQIICTYNRYLWFGLDADVRDLYALYEDMEQMEEYAKRKYDDKYVPVQESDKRRKLTQMYNAVQNGKEYDEQTMQYLYEYIKRQNTSHRREYYKRDLYWTHRRDHLAKVKSLKPFTKYKYLYKKKETNT